jgi:hypothetical protein
MPIMALFRSSQVDRPTYDAIIKELDLERNPAVGALTHVAGFDASGSCVVDVWESRQEFDAFVASRLNPVFAKLKIKMDPPTVLDAYVFNAADGVDRYKPAVTPAESRTFRPEA